MDANPTTDHTDTGLGERVSSRFDDLRDATAGALSSDESPAFRELDRVRDSLAAVEGRLTDRLDAIGDGQDTLADELHAASRRTTVPRKLFWLCLGGAAAAAATWLADPDRGRARRTTLTDEVTGRANDLRSEAGTRIQQVTDRARGTIAEASRNVLPEDIPDDPQVLRQRIKSQVLGHRDDVQDVVLTIGDPGEVTLKGTVGSTTAEQDLIEAVAGINGVVTVDNDLTVTT